MSELTRLVVQHFGAELEFALRAVWQELLCSPLPQRFTVELDGSPRQGAKSGYQPSPRKCQIGSANPRKTEQGACGVQRLRRKRGTLHGGSSSKGKANVA